MDEHTNMANTVNIAVIKGDIFGRTENCCCATKPPVIEATPGFIWVNLNFDPKRKIIAKV